MGAIQNAVDSLITTATSMSYNNAMRRVANKQNQNAEQIKSLLEEQAQWEASPAKVKYNAGLATLTANKPEDIPSNLLTYNKATYVANENWKEHEQARAQNAPYRFQDDLAAALDKDSYATAEQVATQSMQQQATTAATQESNVKNMYEQLKDGKLHTFTRTDSGNIWLKSAEDIEAAGGDQRQADIRRELLAEEFDIGGGRVVRKEAIMDNPEALAAFERGKAGKATADDIRTILKVAIAGENQIEKQNEEDEEHYDEYVQAMSEERDYLTGEQLDKLKSEYDEAVKTKVADETGKDIDYSVDFEPNPDDTPEERKWKNFYKARSEEKRTGQDFIKENADSVPTKDVKYGVKDFFTEYAYKALKNPDKYKKIEDLSYDEAKALYNNYATEQASKNLERRVKAIDKSKDRNSKIKYLRDNSKNRQTHNYHGLMDSDYDLFGPDFVNGKTNTPSYPSIVYEYGLTFDEVFSIWSNLENYVGAAYDHGQPIDDNYSAAILEGIADIAPEKLKAHDEKVSKQANDSLVNSLDKSDEAMFDEYGNVKEEYKEEFNKQLAEEQTVQEETKKNPFDFDDIFKDGKFKF